MEVLSYTAEDLTTKWIGRIRERRIASPDHYRLYFALSDPTHAVTYGDTVTVWNAASSGPEQTGEAILQLHGAAVGGSLTKADILFDRIRTGGYKQANAAQSESLLLSFSYVMDEAYRRRPFDADWVNTLWRRAEELVPLLGSNIEQNRRLEVIETMFGTGAAVGWLTSIFRRETFAHGRYGDQDRPESEWTFSDAELDLVSKIMISRFKKMSLSEIFSTLRPLNLLYAWQQGGNSNGPRELFENSIQSDQDLLCALEGLKTTVHSSDKGTFKVLNRQNIKSFLNFDLTVARIDILLNDPELGSRAQDLKSVLRADSSS